MSKLTSINRELIEIIANSFSIVATIVASVTATATMLWKLAKSYAVEEAEREQEKKDIDHRISTVEAEQKQLHKKLDHVNRTVMEADKRGAARHKTLLDTLKRKRKDVLE